MSGVYHMSVVAATLGKGWGEWEDGEEERLGGGMEEISQMESYYKAIVTS